MKTADPVSGMNVEKVGDSDSHPFANRRIPVPDVHSFTTETLPALHSNRDNLTAVVMEHYLSTFPLLAITLVYMDRDFRS